MQSKLKAFRMALTLMFCFIVGTISAQTVNGNVVDETGEPVIGATVLEKGTKNAVITDFDGNFTIKTQGGKVLTISYIGMVSQDVNIAGKTNVNVVLKEDANTLQDVVVVGYGTMKKQDLTGSVASIETEKLNAKAVINRTELQKFHKELQAAMDVRMGYHISITSGITKAQGGNKTISQLKAETKLMEELPQGKKKLLSQDVSYSPEEDRHLKELAAQGISYLVEKDAIDEDRKKFQASAAAINSKDQLLKERNPNWKKKKL